MVPAVTILSKINSNFPSTTYLIVNIISAVGRITFSKQSHLYMLLAVSERGVDVIQPLFSEHELLLLSGQLLSCRQSNLHNEMLVTEHWRTKNRFPKLLDSFKSERKNCCVSRIVYLFCFDT